MEFRIELKISCIRMIAYLDFMYNDFFFFLPFKLIITIKGLRVVVLLILWTHPFLDFYCKKTFF